MAPLEACHELIVCFVIFVVFDLGIQAVDLADMPSGVLVTRGAGFLQRELYERSAQQDRSEWILAFEC
jgi:hypothetical protein